MICFDEHQAGKDEVVNAFQGCGDAFIVGGQSSEPGGPGKGAFHDPALGQQDKASLPRGFTTCKAMPPAQPLPASVLGLCIPGRRRLA